MTNHIFYGIIHIESQGKTIKPERVKNYMSEKFIVLDVEGLSTCRPYNIGYVVADKDSKIYAKRSFALPEFIFENLQHCLKSCERMTHKNIQEILSDIDRVKYSYTNTERFIRAFFADIMKFRVEDVWAYNCPFDKSSLHRMFPDEDWETLCETITFYDIIPAIVHTVLMSEDYITFCNNHGYITQKGNVMTKAEIVYQFLTGNETFEEEHTGCADAEIELEILAYAMKTGKEWDKEEKRPAWRILKQFCEANEIEIKIPEEVKE